MPAQLAWVGRHVRPSGRSRRSLRDDPALLRCWRATQKLAVLRAAGPRARRRTSSPQDSTGEQGLSLREACNKIIHATKIHFDVSENEIGVLYVNPHIYLYGKKFDKDWKAKLDVLDFARMYTAVVRHY